MAPKRAMRLRARVEKLEREVGLRAPTGRPGPVFVDVPRGSAGDPRALPTDRHRERVDRGGLCIYVRRP
jgi:hypothetical protein